MESVISREERLKKIALDLYQRCKGNRLTLSEFNRVVELLRTTVANEARI